MAEPPRIVDARFAFAAQNQASMPPPTLAEIAFAGRSNVGKSSLLNTLVGRKNLVRAGATPGTTRQINFFFAKATDGLELHLVDLPGYGYARRSKGERTSWGKLIEGYLETRVTLRAVVLLVDVRRGVEPDDQELVDFLAHTGTSGRKPLDLLLVATKVDKVPSSRQKPAVDKIAKATGVRTLGFSAVTGEGADALWRALRSAVLGTPVKP